MADNCPPGWTCNPRPDGKWWDYSNDRLRLAYNAGTGVTFVYHDNERIGVMPIVGPPIPQDDGSVVMNFKNPNPPEQPGMMGVRLDQEGQAELVPPMYDAGYNDGDPYGWGDSPGA